MFTNSAICASGESPRPLNCRDLRQLDRQVVWRHGHHAALVAIHHRDGRAPVALPRDAPVLQAVLNGPRADLALLGCLRHPHDGRCRGKAVELAGVDQRTRAVVRLRHGRARQRPAVGLHDDRNREAVLAGELEVALVVPRHAHHRAGAVLDQDEVRDPDRDRLLRERVDGRPAGRKPFLLHVAGHPRGSVLRLELLQAVTEGLVGISSSPTPGRADAPAPAAGSWRRKSCRCAW